MNFGSDQFYNKLCEEVARGSTDIYAELYNIVKAYTINKLKVKNMTSIYNVACNDVEDIIQEVQRGVFVGLAKYIKIFKDKTPKERNKWLNKIIANEIINYFRKNYKKQNAYNSIKESISFQQNESPQDKQAKKLELQIEIHKLIRTICGFKTSPKKIIAFFFNKVIFLNSSSKTISGSPAEVTQRLQGMKLLDALQILKEELRKALGCNIEDDVFSEMESKIKEDEVFDISSKKISDSSYKISTKIKIEHNTRKKS